MTQPKQVHTGHDRLTERFDAIGHKPGSRGINRLALGKGHIAHDPCQHGNEQAEQVGAQQRESRLAGRFLGGCRVAVAEFLDG